MTITQNEKKKKENRAHQNRAQNKMPLNFHEDPVVYIFDKEDDTWFTKKELKEIRESMRYTLKVLKSNGGSKDAKLMEDSGHCIRGLEIMSNISHFEVIRSKRVKRGIFIGNVLQVQDEHRDMGIKDPIGLSRYSISQSSACRQQARDIAANDAAEASRIYQEDDHISTPDFGETIQKVQESAIAA